MEIVVVSNTGFERQAQITLEAVRFHHPGVAVTALLATPRPIAVPPGFDRVDFACDLEATGAIRFVDVALGWGPHWARWWAIVGLLASDATPGQPRLVLPDHAVLAGSLTALIAEVPAESVGLVPRRGGEQVQIGLGGWVPELVVCGSGAAEVCAAWRDARDELMHVPGTNPWMGGPVGARVTVIDASRVGALSLLPDVNPTRPWDAPDPDLMPPGDASTAAVHGVIERRAESLAAVSGADGSTWSSDPIASLARRPELDALWRLDLLAALESGSPAPPNPYVMGEATKYVHWATTGGDPEVTGVSHLTDLVWSDRPDLAAAFGRPTGPSGVRFSRWLWTYGVSESLISLPELPDPVVPVRRIEVVEHPPFGVNLVGYHQAEAGLGVAVRRVARSLDAAGIDWVAVDNTRTASRREAASSPLGDPRFRFNLMLMAPDQVAGFVDEVGPELLANRYTIGLWYWETDRLNPAQRHGLDYVDEIWGATDYLRDIFAANTALPVRRVPIPFAFDDPDRSNATRERVGLDDRFTFLFSFDFLSVAARKNPLGVVEAYRRAFPEVGDQRLVLKSINGSRFADVRKRLNWAIGDRPDIELWDRYLDASDRLSLVALSDVYVSLHRSEGLGLTIAEAMAVGTPVIASRYSGNLDFSDDTTAWLIDGQEILVGPGHHYPPDGHWFDPDIQQAAEVMRRLASDPTASRSRSAAAKSRVAEFSPAFCGELAMARLRELWLGF